MSRSRFCVFLRARKTFALHRQPARGEVIPGLALGDDQESFPFIKQTKRIEEKVRRQKSKSTKSDALATNRTGDSRITPLASLNTRSYQLSHRTSGVERILGLTRRTRSTCSSSFWAPRTRKGLLDFIRRINKMLSATATAFRNRAVIDL